MAWIEVNLKTLREKEELVTSFLMDLGVDGVNIEDDKLLYDYSKKKNKADLIEAPKSYSNFILIKTFFDESDYDLKYRNLIYDFQKDLKSKGIDVEITKEEKLIDTNWATEWMKYYEIIHIGNIVIVPEWKDYKGEDKEYIVRINPGLAFGTGDHATTAMCLEYIQNIDIKGKKVLDMGCGSGILSIASEKLGAKKVLAVDYDQDAIDKSKENIELNSCENIVTVKSNLTSNIEGKFDVALVNIIAEIIVDLLEDLHKYLNEGAEVIFTGILEEKEDLVVDAMKDRYEILNIKREDGWLAISGKCIDIS